MARERVAYGCWPKFNEDDCRRLRKGYSAGGLIQTNTILS